MEKGRRDLHGMHRSWVTTMKKRPFLLKRRLLQLYAALLYNANLKGFIQGRIYTGDAKKVCVPGLNCYSCPGAGFSCPLGALQNALSAADKSIPWYVLGILLLCGITLGRGICGFLCPVGFLQEMLYKVPVPKLKKSRWTRRLSWLKYIILFVFVLSIPVSSALAGVPVPAFCKFICPAGTLEGAGGLLLHSVNSAYRDALGALFGQKLIVLLLILLLSCGVFRVFCRFLCPLGAIYSLFNRVSVVGMRVDEDRCTSCGRCIRECKMDVRRVGDRECIMCGECVGTCAAGAISLKAGKIVLHTGDSGCQAEKKTRGSVIKKAVFPVLLIAALAFALVYYNVFDRPAPQDATAGQTAQICLQGLEGETIRLSDSRGKPVVINFWATWCGPCLQELPDFCHVYQEVGESATILLVHVEDGTEKQEILACLASLDLPLSCFAMDEGAEAWKHLGDANMALPKTVILNGQGEVVYSQAGSMNKQTLTELLLPLLSEE